MCLYLHQIPWCDWFGPHGNPKSSGFHHSMQAHPPPRSQSYLIPGTSGGGQIHHKWFHSSFLINVHVGTVPFFRESFWFPKPKIGPMWGGVVVIYNGYIPVIYRLYVMAINHVYIQLCLEQAVCYNNNAILYYHVNIYGKPQRIRLMISVLFDTSHFDVVAGETCVRLLQETFCFFSLFFLRLFSFYMVYCYINLFWITLLPSKMLFVSPDWTWLFWSQCFGHIDDDDDDDDDDKEKGAYHSLAEEPTRKLVTASGRAMSMLPSGSKRLEYHDTSAPEWYQFSASGGSLLMLLESIRRLSSQLLWEEPQVLCRHARVCRHDNLPGSALGRRRNHIFEKPCALPKM